ncbi:MAG TPA: FAD-dependent oxidoreductase, partial [Gallionella sp.]|nr:FAD-dependent oxidoreductase [Gallionella sp.]
MKPVVVLGSGLAGYTLVRELRKLDHATAITLISRDSADYYSKPMLSNAFAQGKSAAALVNTAASEMARQLDITVLQNTEVSGIQPELKQLQTSAGVIEYERLVLALGADPIRLPLHGDAAAAVLSVNDLEDYARLRDLLVAAKQIAIIGGGLIGCEFANDLAVAGYGVTVIDPTAYPLSSLIPEQAGRQLLEPMEKLGVRWRFGAAVTAVDKLASGYALTLADGSILQADVVLSAVGLRPRVELARVAGLTVNRGIVVDAQLRSSDAAIYALGDCAEIEGRVLPYVLPIMHAARTLAQVLAGKDMRVTFPAMPVVVKTPAHPVAVVPVARDAQGAWQLLANGSGAKLGFFDAQNQLQ